MTSSTDIVIIGAGPTGLMLACQLSLYPNIVFRIIDKNASCTTQSRALVIHARSLEILAQLKLVDKALAQGTLADAMKGYFQGKRAIKVDLAQFRTKQQPLNTRYPHVLFLEQSATEQLLESYLHEHGIQVERNIEVIDIKDFGDAGAEVTLSNGEILRPKYVCACDGARSIVRHKLNLSFSGRTYSESLFVADCEVDRSPCSTKEMAFFCESTGLSGIFPIRDNRFRLIGTIHEGYQDDIHLSIDDVRKIIHTRTRRSDINISNCNWISVYRSHHRHITTFRYRKHYFLLGDAAHIHSPVGGQGMNTGLQDAHNLAWKLAYVLTHSAHDRLLDTYHNERFKVAENLVNTTDRAFSFLSSQYWLTRLFRLYITPYILRFLIQPILNSSQRLRQYLFRRLSQTAITYRSSKIYDYGASAGQFHRTTPLPGDRFPYVIFEPCYYHFVIFENQQQSTKVKLFIDFVKEKYSKIVRIHEEDLPVRFEGAILVRPDGYIAYRTTVFDINHFQAYFSQYLLFENI
ncbi:unnamed protein product [Adineta ricciae]|uniref:FAD-binding domain-containing protein n=1 Tax=Adineta ricciae TaxID=249248 RepID=A0A815HHP8_ADIRI|nr:unnamed protein product [Adineta ricciae]